MVLLLWFCICRVFWLVGMMGGPVQFFPFEPALTLAMTRSENRSDTPRYRQLAALYEQGRVVHAGRFVELEDQMCDFGPEGLSSGRSPDRLDALVWALTALMLEGAGEPRIRGV